MMVGCVQMLLFEMSVVDSSFSNGAPSVANDRNEARLSMRCIYVGDYCTLAIRAHEFIYIYVIEYLRVTAMCV